MYIHTGKTAHEITEITDLPMKTIYAQLNEYLEHAFNSLNTKLSNDKRERPSNTFPSASTSPLQ